MSNPVTIWDKIDATPPQRATAPASGEEEGEESPSRKIEMPRLWLLDLIATPLWLYFIVQLFFFDVDDYLFEDLLGLEFNPADYRLFFFLAALVGIVIFVRKHWFVLLYVLFFPLVVLLWKLPRLIYKTRSWLVLLVVINVVANFIKSFKYVVITVALSSFSILAILVSHWPPVLLAGVLGLFALLVISYYRVVVASFSGSRFVRGQQAMIRRFTDSELVWQLAQVDENLRRPEIERFDEAQVNAFVGKVSTGLLLHRALYFWAYQLDRYRESPAPSYFSYLSYAWLFGISVITFWMTNLAILKINPEGFDFMRYPSNLLVLLYSLRTFAFGGLESFEPRGNWQVAVGIAAGIVGGLLLATLVANLVFGARARRQADAIRQLVDELKGRAGLFEERLVMEYEIPVSDALRRLEEMGRGLVAWIAYLSARIPSDFLDS